MTKRFRVGDGKPRIDRVHQTWFWPVIDLGANWWRWRHIRSVPQMYVVGGIMWGRR